MNRGELVERQPADAPDKAVAAGEHVAVRQRFEDLSVADAHDAVAQQGSCLDGERGIWLGKTRGARLAFGAKAEHHEGRNCLNHLHCSCRA
jgi:hypothetical protein